MSVQSQIQLEWNNKINIFPSSVETIDEVTTVIDNNFTEDVLFDTCSETNNDIQANNLIYPQYGRTNKAELQEI